MGEVIFGRFPNSDAPAHHQPKAPQVDILQLDRHISSLGCWFALNCMEKAVGEQLFRAIPYAEKLKRNWLDWIDFRELLKRHGLKPPADADQPDALYHVIRWTLRDLKGWSDKMSRECCEDIGIRQWLIKSEQVGSDELTASDITRILERAHFFRRKDSG